MYILPAIDLYDKKAVRLYKGDYEKMTVYSENPTEIAAAFRAAGAEYIHMVDLEGARDGTTPNFDIVADIARNSGLKVEIGGGIRTEETVKKYLDCGVYRVILGTAALTDEVFLGNMVTKYGSRIAVGVDCRDGYVAIKGWTEVSRITCSDFCRKLQNMGVSTVICTDISRDGAMRGTNRELYKQLNDTYQLNIIASGGVTDLSDIAALREMGMHGAIVGKAWYTGAIKLEEALEMAK